MADSVNLVEALATLQQGGADAFDPVTFHRLQSLSQRMLAHRGETRKRLEQSFEDLRSALANQLAQAHAEAGKQQGVFAPAIKPKSPLGDLLEEMGVVQNAQQAMNDQHHLVLPQALKAIQQFGSTWSELSIDSQVTQAIDQAPENAGPLNSHNLVLRSIAQMREISPAYLNRFITYIDTLMCLEQANKKPRQNSARTSIKSTRARSRKASNTEQS
jgi:Protein of unknown function (DUF2894)